MRACSSRFEMRTIFKKDVLLEQSFGIQLANRSPIPGTGYLYLPGNDRNGTLDRAGSLWLVPLLLGGGRGYTCLQHFHAMGGKGPSKLDPLDKLRALAGCAPSPRSYF
jgi:hypothetical protein